MPQILTKKRKRLGIRTASWAAKGHLHILEYLVERKHDEYDEGACKLAAEFGQLDCLKYLHETAKAPWDDDAVEAHDNNHRMCTIPPRQRLPITIWLAIRTRRVTHVILYIHTQREREREREREKERRRHEHTQSIYKTITTIF